MRRTRSSETTDNAATVSGFGPSTTTITSRSWKVCASTLLIARKISFGRRVVGMIVETIGIETHAGTVDLFWKDRAGVQTTRRSDKPTTKQAPGFLDQLISSPRP